MTKFRILFVSLVSAFVVSTITFAAMADDLSECEKQCGLAGKITCGSDVDIRVVCADIPECKDLSDDKAKIVNDFCEACRAEERTCGPTAITPVPTTPPPAMKKPVVASKPLTPEQFCSKQDGVMVDGVCYTLKTVIDELKRLEKEKTDPEAFNKRIEGLKNADVPESYKKWVQDLINKNMSWTTQKFEIVSYKFDEIGLHLHARSQRDDLHDRQIAQLQRAVGSLGGGVSPLLTFQFNGFGNVHFFQPYDEIPFAAGGEVVWLPEFLRNFHGLLGVGLGYSGEVEDESLATFHLQAGLHGHVAKHFHLAGGFVMEQTMVGFAETHSQFYGAFVEPSVCIWDEGPTMCIGMPIALGGTRFQYRSILKIDTVVDGSIGFSVGFMNAPKRHD